MFPAVLAGSSRCNGARTLRACGMAGAPRLTSIDRILKGEKPARGDRNSVVFYRSAECPLLAQSGHSESEFQCPLSGVLADTESVIGLNLCLCRNDFLKYSCPLYGPKRGYGVNNGVNKSAILPPAEPPIACYGGAICGKTQARSATEGPGSICARSPPTFG